MGLAFSRGEDMSSEGGGTGHASRSGTTSTKQLTQAEKSQDQYCLWRVTVVVQGFEGVVEGGG